MNASIGRVVVKAAEAKLPDAVVASKNDSAHAAIDSYDHSYQKVNEVGPERRRNNDTRDKMRKYAVRVSSNGSKGSQSHSAGRGLSCAAGHIAG